MADNYLDPRAWRSDMDAPQPNHLAPATLKPGPAPTGYEKLFDVVKGLRDILQFNTPMAGLWIGLGAAATWPGEDTR